MNYLGACQWSSEFYTSAETRVERLHRSVEKEKEGCKWHRRGKEEVSSRDGRGKRIKERKRNMQELDLTAIQVTGSILCLQGSSFHGFSLPFNHEVDALCEV